jgi:ABC-type antimicrobial peptide transport system permease subunit
MKLVVTVIISASMFALLMLSEHLMHSVRQSAELDHEIIGSQTPIILFVTAEAILLFASAAILGTIAATLLYPLLGKAIDAPVTSMPLQVPFVAVLIAVLAAIVSSLFPALRIRRVEVATALARVY